AVSASFAWTAPSLADPKQAKADHAETLYFVRLTPAQYQRTIHDVFGSNIRVLENRVAPGVREEGLLALGSRKPTISYAGMWQYVRQALDISDQASDPRRRASLLGCKPKDEKAPDSVCATSFIKRVRTFLFRRPLTDAETQM